MLIKIDDSESPDAISVESEVLTDSLYGLTLAARRQAAWLADFNKLLLFPDSDTPDPEEQIKRCDLCEFIDQVADTEISRSYDFMRLTATHRAVHEAAMQLYQDHLKGTLQPGEYETFRRTDLRSLYYIDRLRQQSAYSIAYQDPLTGLLTRAAMDSYLLEEESRAKRTKRTFSIALLDLDHFKKINDTYGHPAGDEVLTKIAGLLDESIRPYDEGFRYGGEEFLVLLPEADKNAAVEAMERLRERVEGSVVMADDVEIRVTVSIGVAEFSQDQDIENLLKTADENLYKAKEGGRNRIVTNV